MLEFYLAPYSRASSVHWLLEEIGEPYEVKLIDIRGKVPDSYRKVHAHKKVPALRDNGVTITERAAITLYLTEKFPHKGLAPKLGDPLRGRFLSNLIYCDSVMDPALALHSLKIDYSPSSVSFGAFEDVVNHVEQVLSQGPYVLGDQFSAVDTQWGSALQWGIEVFPAFPKKTVFLDYLDRLKSRPAFHKAMADEARWMTDARAKADLKDAKSP
jgi:glutathione S-transferase